MGGFDYPLEVPQRIINTLGDNSPAFKVVTLDLSTARDKEKHGWMGSMLWAYDASDISANCDIRFNDQVNDPLTFKQGQSLAGHRYNEVYITNAAQAGKSLTFLYALEDSQIRIENPGAAFSSVTLSKATVLGTIADVTVVAGAAAAQVVPTNADAVSVGICSLQANTQNIRIGDTNTGAARGIEIAPGETIVLDTTAPIFAYTAAGANQTLAITYTQD